MGKGGEEKEGWEGSGIVGSGVGGHRESRVEGEDGQGRS